MTEKQYKKLLIDTIQIEDNEDKDKIIELLKISTISFQEEYEFTYHLPDHRKEHIIISIIPEKLQEIKKYKDIENAEVEDLIPFRLIERGINRIFHDLEDMYFEDEYEEKSAIVPQIEEFASKNNVALEKGWKVEVARNMKHMLKNKNIMQEIKDEDMEIWKKIFIDFDK